MASRVDEQAVVALSEAENVQSTPSSDDSNASSWLLKFILFFDRKSNQQECPTTFEPLPQYNPEAHHASTSTAKSVFYLAYGSNLCAATFQGNRGIRPLSAINVVVPELELVFNLPGLPYLEPCYASTRFRCLDTLPKQLQSITLPSEVDALLASSELEESKDIATASAWTKGCVGVVYELMPEDYAHIIATEGGGSSYADIEVSCFPLPQRTSTVPRHPQGSSFKVHTLFARSDGLARKGRDGWAQPSKRYLGLVTTGANEHGLPKEYRIWLRSLQPYTITSWRQKVGRSLFVATFFPLIVGEIILERATADEQGRVPAWVTWLVGRCFVAIWFAYDWGFKWLWGEGERTME